MTTQHIESKIKNYLDTYFTPNELTIMKKQYYHDYGYNDTTVYDPEYIVLSKLYKKLLNFVDDEKYRLEVDVNCRSLIKTIFERYVKKDTFVITTVEQHSSVQDLVRELDQTHTYKICIGGKEHLAPDLIKRILTAYKKTNCTNIVVLIPGVVPGFSYIFDQKIFECLKKELVKSNIPHILVLDDCQGILYTQRNYELFDIITFTADTLFIGFKMGMLFTRLKQQLGYINKSGLKRFGEKLVILAKHKDKAMQFNSLMSEYFADSFNDAFQPIVGVTPQYFTVQTSEVIVPREYADELVGNYRLTFNESNAPISWFRARSHEAIIQQSDRFLSGLSRTKQIFEKLTRYRELNDKKLQQGDILYKSFEDLNKCIYDIENAFYGYTDTRIIEQAKYNNRHYILDYYGQKLR